MWQTVYHRFLPWRDHGVFQALMDGMIAEAAARGQVDLSLVSVDSAVARAHHDAAGMAVDEEVLVALEKAAEEEKGARTRNERDKSQQKKPPLTPTVTSADGNAADAGPD